MVFCGPNMTSVTRLELLMRNNARGGELACEHTGNHKRSRGERDGGKLKAMQCPGDWTTHQQQEERRVESGRREGAGDGSRRSGG